jgi:glycosyltransferase involved in cell wall biosynthesis
LVPPDDPLSLAKAIADFARDPAALRQRAAAARSHLQKNYDPETNMGEVIRLWESARDPSRGHMPDG